MLTINNIYGHGYGEAQIARLRSLGFNIRDRVSTYAGSQRLRFIDFDSLPYLEFIEVESEQEYFDFLPRGMVPYCPGINLLIPQHWSNGISELQQRYQEWGSYSIHVNYDGSDAPDQPGWNYLNFDIPVVRDTFVYLMTMDEPKPVKNVATDHPNSAQHVVGLVFNLDEAELVKLADVTGGELVGGEIDLEGVKIGSSEAMAGKYRIRQKQFPLAAIVIQADSIDFFRDKEEVTVFEYLSKPTVYIEAPELSWDLIVTT